VIRPSPEGTGSLETAGSIPVGASVQITTADTDEVLAGTRAALERAVAEFPSGARPDAALLFSCAVRKFMLGSRAPVEAELARSVLGDVPTIGTYCYGEVGPLAGASSSRFLNETFVALLLGT
jgi:small ligand-binding sensory domain FIST